MTRRASGIAGRARASLRAALLLVMSFGTCSDAAAAPPPAVPEVARCELGAMARELERGVASLRLPDAPAPYLAIGRIMRWKSLALDGSYGGIITDIEEVQAVGTVEVRVGAPARDNANMFGQDGAQIRFLLALEPAPAFTRKKLWLATDQAFRAAASTYAQKQAILARLAGDPPPPDLGPAPPREAPPAATDVRDASFDRAGLRDMVEGLSARFKEHPAIDNGDVYAQLLVAEGSMASSEGTRLRDRSARAVLAVTAQARAADGMLLDHGRALHFQELPTATAELRAAGEQLVDAVLGELEAIAAAPMLDEDYDGPLLFTGDAAAQLLASTVATEAAGTPAPLADGGRMLELEPHWQDSLGKSVMPEFLDLRDDPSAEGFGRYELDAEGFRAKPITLVERGELRDLLMTRAPNEHLSQSNGRARMSPVLQIAPAISNLTLRSRQPGKSEKALERELLRRAREDGYEFAYVITTLRDGTILGPVPREGAISFASGRKVSLAPPLLIYRIDASGKRTLVRGAVFSPVSLRVLRRIRAVGATTHAVPLRILAGSQGGFGGETGMDGILSHTVDVQVNAPDLLIDGFELLVERGEHERLPTLVHPLRDEGWSAR